MGKNLFCGLNIQFLSMKITIYSSFLLLLLSSCMEDLEKDRQYPVTPIPDEVSLATIPLTEEYRYQFYYDLSENTVTAQNDKEGWDIAFDNRTDKKTIWLNTANFMDAGVSEETDFDAVNSHQGIAMTFDRPAMSDDTTAIGAWWQHPEKVIVINRGITYEGQQKGYKKIKLSYLESGKYVIHFANLNGSDEQLDTISKESHAANRILYSFDGGGEELQIAPDSPDWDLWFTQYTKMLYAEGEPYPYLVVGALSNRSRIRTAQLQAGFEEVDGAAADTASFYPYADLIGYDWKELTGDVESGDVSYVIRNGLTYLVHEMDNNSYYKLRFTGFYNETGRKGYPAFEYQQIYP